MFYRSKVRCKTCFFCFGVVFSVYDAYCSLISALEILGVPHGLVDFFLFFFCLHHVLHGHKYVPVLIH